MNAKRSTQTKTLIILTTLATLYNPHAHAAPIELHEALITNVNAGRYLIDDATSEVIGPSHSPWVGVAIGAGIAVCALSEACQRDVNRAYLWLRGKLFDPQDASLFSSIKVDDVEYLDELIDFSLQPENVLGQFSLPGFMGGALYTATDAFSGAAFNKNMGPMPAVQVGYGVLQTNGGADYFVATNFAVTLQDLLNVAFNEYDLTPALPTGSIIGERLGMRVFDTDANFETYVNTMNAFDPAAPVPEPGTLLLLGISLAGLLCNAHNRPSRRGQPTLRISKWLSQALVSKWLFRSARSGGPFPSVPSLHRKWLSQDGIVTRRDVAKHG